jgi:hypothetical protein
MKCGHGNAVIDEAKNLAASDKMRRFFASLRMTSVVVV